MRWLRVALIVWAGAFVWLFFASVTTTVVPALWRVIGRGLLPLLVGRETQGLRHACFWLGALGAVACYGHLRSACYDGHPGSWSELVVRVEKAVVVAGVALVGGIAGGWVGWLTVAIPAAEAWQWMQHWDYDMALGLAVVWSAALLVPYWMVLSAVVAARALRNLPGAPTTGEDGA